MRGEGDRGRRPPLCALSVADDGFSSCRVRAAEAFRLDVEGVGESVLWIPDRDSVGEVLGTVGRGDGDGEGGVGIDMIAGSSSLFSIFGTNSGFCASCLVTNLPFISSSVRPYS